MLYKLDKVAHSLRMKINEYSYKDVFSPYVVPQVPVGISSFRMRS